jgi:hypothetical protein
MQEGCLYPIVLRSTEAGNLRSVDRSRQFLVQIILYIHANMDKLDLWNSCWMEQKVNTA